MLTAGCKTNVMNWCAAWAHSIHRSFLYLFKIGLSLEKIILVMVACEYEQIVIFFPLSYWEKAESPWRPWQCHLQVQEIHLYLIISWFPSTGDTEHLSYSILETHIHLYLCTSIMWLKRCWRLECLCRFIFTAAGLTVRKASSSSYGLTNKLVLIKKPFLL